MRRQSGLISLVVLCALVVFGPSVVRADTSQDVSVAVGEQFTIDLASNPSTGYQWVLAGTLPSWLQQVGKSYVATNPGLPGGGGTDHWIFQATAAGSADLTFQYKRPWETTVAQTHVCHVTATAGTAGFDITVLTYNTHLFEDTIVATFAPVMNYHDDTTRRHRIVEKIKTCGANIVALEEVWAYANQQYFTNELKAIYPYSYIEDSSRHSYMVVDTLGNGLVLLSQWPLLDVAFERYSIFEYSAVPGNYDCWANKGILTATVDTGHGPIRVGITHAPTGGDDQKGEMSRHYVDITPFYLNGQPYIFGLHVDVGANIWRINDYGVSCSQEKGCFHGAGKELVKYGATMSPNYLFVRSFPLNGHPYIFGLHDKGGDNAEAKVWRINDDPTTGITLLDKAGGGPTSSNYVAMESFELNGHSYLFGLHDSGGDNGEAKLWRINDDPATGMTLLDKSKGGPTSSAYVFMTVFQVNGHPYIFGLHANGNAVAGYSHVYVNMWRINDDPATGMTLVCYEYTKGPTSAKYVAMTSFQLNGHPYIFGLQGGGYATIWQINDDPSTGMKQVAQAAWSSEYRFIKSFELNGHPYLFGLKDCCDQYLDVCLDPRPGEAYITRINDDPSTGWEDVLQMEDMRTIADKTIIKDGPPAVMMGDFNVHISRYGVMNDIFKQAGAVDAYVQVNGLSKAGNTVDLGTNKFFRMVSTKDVNDPNDYPKEGSCDRIDYVFVKEAGAGYTLVPQEVTVIRNWTYNDTNDLIPDMDLSDHYPILAKFQLMPADTSLVLYLPFNEGVGGKANDASGYGNRGTVCGANWVTGQQDTALEFVSGSHVTIPEIPQYDVTSAVSVLAWIKATTSPNWGRVLDKSQYQTSGFDLCLMYTAGKPRLEFFVNNTTSAVDGTSAVADGKWHFIAGTFGNKILRMYVDGKKEAETGSTGKADINPNNLQIMIGDYVSLTGTQQYYGSIDEVAMYNRELSADEVMSIFQNGIHVEK